MSLPAIEGGSVMFLSLLWIPACDDIKGVHALESSAAITLDSGHT